MGVAKNHGSHAGGVGMQVQILARVKHVDQFSIELNGFSGRQFAAGSDAVHIAANRREWRDVPQSVENVVVADISGVEDVGAADERLHGFWAQ